ncbi:SIR2-domain-containing protein [Xylariaceae sp. FL0255]|nr:SIR2-domain-containing protein [Xylariaceae sp. FL0255]
MRAARQPTGRPRKSQGRARQQPQVHVTEVIDDQQIGHLPLPQPIYNDELQDRVNDLGDSWETESIFEDIMDDLTQDTFPEDVDAFTPAEAARYRQQLRAIGPDEFCQMHLDSGSVTAKKMLTAFGIRPPPFLEGRPDDSYFALLTLAMSRELGKRAKLNYYNSVDDAVALLQRSHNIIVLTGAGISTSLGIPDFRSKENGLYSQLEKLDLGVTDPQEVFNIETFRHDPTIFYTVAKDILPATKKFSPTHAFIAMLQNKGKLLTNYSQNIDNIEANAGVKPEKLVQCHGSFATASCQKCGHRVRGDTIYDEIRAGKIPRCGKCVVALKTKGPLKRKRSSNSASSKRSRRNFDDFDDDDDDPAYDIPTAGVMKPDITFFGEALPDEFSKRLIHHDRELVDLVVVIGTSLKVAPVSEVSPFLPSHIPQIYISRTPITHINFDIDLLGDCDVVVEELCRRAGWDLNHPMMVPLEKEIKVELEAGYDSRHVFKVAAKPGIKVEQPPSAPKLEPPVEDTRNLRLSSATPNGDSQTRPRRKRSSSRSQALA